MIRQSLLLILLTSFLAACSSSGGKMPADNVMPVGTNGGHSKTGNPYKVSGKWYYPKEDPTYEEVGIASWYGKQFHGKKTANGEIFNMNALTAAHKTLPLPTNVKVTNLNNGRSIIVRVNDRGPFVGKRVIDLSRRAAQILAFTNEGTTKVRIQVVDQYGKVAKSSKKYAKNTHRNVPKVTSKATAAVTDAGSLVIQAGSFRLKDNAQSRLRELKNAGIKATISQALVSGVTYFRVIIDGFSDRGGAEGALEAIQSRGFYDARIIAN